MTHFKARFGKLFPVLVASGVLLAGCGGGGGGGGGSDSDDAPDVRGVIDIAAGSRVDGDYADLWNATGSGSDATVKLPVPSTTGGYLSDKGGAYGNGLEYPADTEDTYQVTLADGDRYFLQCFPSTGANAGILDVSLSLSLDGSEIDDACGAGGTVSSSGSATFTISANSGGPFRYVLSIAPKTSLAASDVRWPEPELRENEAIVTGPAAVTSTMSSSGLQASSVMDVERAIGPDTWQVRRTSGVNTLAEQSAVSGGDSRAETIEWIRGMREEFGLNVEPNYLFKLMANSPENDPFYSNVDDVTGLPDNWNLQQINVENAWASTAAWGAGVDVAIIDTGLFSTDLSAYGNWHEDLAANVVDEGGLLDFVGSDYDVDEDEGRDGNPATPLTPATEEEPDKPERTSFHGTHVAGIVAAVDNDKGTVGIASQATILPYRVLGVDPVDGDDGTGAVSDLIAAINDTVARNERSDRSDVDAINLSLGGLPHIDALQDATDSAYASGILVVAAGGNSGDASAVYPAANRKVVGVGATNRNGELASYSNYGQSVDLLAPGGGLNDGIVNAYGKVSGSSSLSDDYAYLSGSSMAVPHVAGVYALMKGIEDITPARFRALMIAGDLTTTDGPDGAYTLDNYTLHGVGLLDAKKAVDNINGFPTVVSAWPRVVELSPSGNERRILLEVLTPPEAPIEPVVTGTPSYPTSSLTLTDGEGNPISVNDPIPDAVRISVDPDAVPDDRPLVEEIRIPYSNESGSDRDLIIPVYVQAADTSGDRNAGRHYVLLLDVDDFDSSRSRQVLASYNDGQYRFSLDDVAPGDYILVAGTDLDNNGFICENGEACAEYPRTGARQVISIGEDQSRRLDMSTSFRRPGIAEMGLPRYGFEGYPIPDLDAGNGDDRKQLE